MKTRIKYCDYSISNNETKICSKYIESHLNIQGSQITIPIVCYVIYCFVKLTTSLNVNKSNLFRNLSKSSIKKVGFNKIINK